MMLSESLLARNQTTAYCRACDKLRQAKYGPAVRRNRVIKKRYGITSEEYGAMFEGQGGARAICRRPPKQEYLHIDHDHGTGELRGLLCPQCNHCIEWFLSNAAAARAYLNGPSSPFLENIK